MGHTRGDAFACVAQRKVLFTGDACVHGVGLARIVQHASPGPQRRERDSHLLSRMDGSASAMSAFREEERDRPSTPGQAEGWQPYKHHFERERL
jgi:hypothetical protein